MLSEPFCPKSLWGFLVGFSFVINISLGRTNRQFLKKIYKLFYRYFSPMICESVHAACKNIKPIISTMLIVKYDQFLSKTQLKTTHP